jgi:hypothetical protein
MFITHLFSVLIYLLVIWHTAGSQKCVELTSRCMTTIIIPSINHSILWHVYGMIMCVFACLFVCLFVLETGSHYVAQADLKFRIFLPQPLECWVHTKAGLPEVKAEICENTELGNWFCQVESWKHNRGRNIRVGIKKKKKWDFVGRRKRVI